MENNNHYIIDCGHGGILKGRYTTFPRKMYSFNNNNNFTIYEGLINRRIGNKLALKLKEFGFSYSFSNHEYYDTSLHERVEHEHLKYEEFNGNTLFISLHSNSSSNSNRGDGGKARGNEIYTSIGQTDSDVCADIIARLYKESLPNMKLRQDTVSDGDLDKEANFYVLHKTRGKSILIETGFFDNIDDALLLEDESFQSRIANIIAEGISIIDKIKFN